MALALTDLLAQLEEIAPARYAEAWDNVGLLLDPRQPGEEIEVRDVLLTIDATPSVLEELAQLSSACLVAYHPPLFRPLGRVSRTEQPWLFQALVQGVPIYSPHTALDSCPDGLNDWLIEGAGAGEQSPLQPWKVEAVSEYWLTVYVPETHAESLLAALHAAGAGVVGDYEEVAFQLRGTGRFRPVGGARPAVGSVGRAEQVSELRIELRCAAHALSKVSEALHRTHPYEEPVWEMVQRSTPAPAGAGRGRRVVLHEPQPLTALVERFKAHLGLARLRLAACPQHEQGQLIRSVGVAAGSGASVFESGAPCDLLVTGECSHHTALGHLRNGRSVIATEHSNSERGYLPRLAERLRQRCAGKVAIHVAQTDRDPMQIV